MIAYSYNDPRSSDPPPSPPDPEAPPPSYTRHSSIPSSSRVTILVSCPNLSSWSWLLSLYGSVCGGMGVLLSSVWVGGHGYVLHHTVDKDLRIQR